MSDDGEKSRILQAIDAEITSINERHRLEGLTSWAVAAAIIWLLGAAATAWEAGGIRWQNVATLALAILLASDVVATLLTDSSSRSVTDPPFRLWMYPHLAALLLQLALFATAYCLRHDVPTWSAALALATFGSGAIFFAVLHPGLARLLSKTAAVENAWNRRSQRPHDAGVRGTLFLGRWVRPAIYAILALVYGQGAYSMRPGESLRDLRLAVIIVLIVMLLGLAMRDRSAPILVELRELRRDVTLDRMSPSDATDAFLATIVGIRGAPYVIAKCREAIDAIRELRSEAEGVLQGLGDHGRPDQEGTGMGVIRQRVAMLDSKVRQVWTITKAQQSMYEVLHPQGAQLLSSIVEELEAQIESLGVCGRAVQDAMEAGLNPAKASDT